MKGCARSLVLAFAAYLAIAAVIAWLLHQFFGLSPRLSWPAAFGAAVFGWAGLSLFFTIPERLRERGSIRACLRGERPVHGRQVGLVGTIDAVGPLLRAPLSGTECVAYKYAISMLQTGGNRRRIVPMVEGMALTPSVIASPCGSFRLLAVPAFDGGGPAFSDEVAMRNAAELLRTGRFETAVARGDLERELTDDDGAFRRDRNLGPADLPLAECSFREDVVRPGEKVYVNGFYSEARGGIVPQPNWAKQTRLLRGDIEEVTGQLQRQIRNYAVGAVICCAIAAGIVAAFVAQVRSG